MKKNQQNGDSVSPDEKICRRNGGGTWKCKRIAANNSISYCDHHYQQYNQNRKVDKRNKKKYSSVIKSQNKKTSDAVPIVYARRRHPPSVRRSLRPQNHEALPVAVTGAIQADIVLPVDTSGIIHSTVVNQLQIVHTGAGVEQTEEICVNQGVSSDADQSIIEIDTQPLDQGYLIPDAVVNTELASRLLGEDNLQVNTAVVERVEPGAPFEQQMTELMKGNQIVGGFSVRACLVPLYTKIWKKYGHIATTRVIISCPGALVTTVDDLLQMIASMENKTLNDVTGDMLEEWEKLLLTCENLKFNVSWLRQKIDSIKADWVALDVHAPSPVNVLKQEEEAILKDEKNVKKIIQDYNARVKAYNTKKEEFLKGEKAILKGLF